MSMARCLNNVIMLSHKFYRIILDEMNFDSFISFSNSFQLGSISIFKYKSTSK
jgi:hypothetical protein